MQSRQRFLNAFSNQAPDRPPVWIMRQAGRYLPEYRALKERHDFLTLVKTPDLATEVTLQPLRRYPLLDAGIIFSDILIIPEAMGLPYRFREQGGIEMASAIRNPADIRSLQPEAVREKTAYLPQALRQVRSELGQTKALLGFAGSPWTLATYMIEGGSSHTYEHAKALFHQNRSDFDSLMGKITRAVSELFLSQIEAGVDALQIFDSWAAAAPEGEYWNASLKWIQQIIQSLPEGFPVIVFPKGMTRHHEEVLQTGTQALAADHGIDLPEWRRSLPQSITVQGNLDPHWMTRAEQEAAQAAADLLKRMRPFHRYIFNLGHGITPQARPETVQAVLECVAAGGRLPQPD